MKAPSFEDLNIGRVETFSDGVFTVVATLLVFDLHFPHINHPTNANVWMAILSTLPKLIAWINSFLVVCVIWMNHHRFIQILKRIDPTIFWLNNLLLMFISLLPFPTNLMGEYVGNNSATCFYGLCMAMPTLFFSGMGNYLTKHTQLLKVEFDIDILRKSARLHSFLGPSAYLAGAALSWVNSWLAILIYTTITLYFIFPRIRLL
ncbi:putative membrane protein [Mucilaginibacter gracilis]|uniref:Putative membrane protein n=1 Tax=Mucilaginibacter gracilis TaxID=423350 RepID=A0A495IWH5_9SPHI|nr:TMEM175 family protein [Mucilaginibacter gracilis]RKR80374.1 putative membrane protein [Mucilaginibacter gracilis]